MSLLSEHLALIFAAGLILFALIFAFPAQTADNWFCASDDKSVGVCVRNWFSGAGNFLVALIAMVAARFAFRQWKASDRQAATAALPFLEARMQKIEVIHVNTIKLANSFLDLAESLTNIHGLVVSDGHDREIIRNTLIASSKVPALIPLRDFFSENSRSISVDNDLQEISARLFGLCNLLQHTGFYQISYFLRDMSIHGGANEECEPIVVLIRQNNDRVRLAAQEMRRSMEGVNQCGRQLIDLAAKLKSRRLDILAVGDSTPDA